MRILKEMGDCFICEYEVGNGKCKVRKLVFDWLRDDHAVFLGRVPGTDYVAGTEFRPRKGVFLFGMVFGRTGMGKSTFLRFIASQLMSYGHGLAVIDPHGTLMKDILKMVPPNRITDVVIFDPLAISKYGRIIPFNPLHFESSRERMMVREDIVNVLSSVFKTSVGSRMAQITELVADILVSAAEDLELSKVCLADAYWVLASKKRREELLKYVSDELVAEANERIGELDMGSGGGMYEFSGVGSVLSRLRPLVHSIIAPLFRYADSFVSPRMIVDDGLLAFVNLAKGELREEASNLLQDIFARFLFSAGLSPARTRGRVMPFFFIVDEAHNYDLSIFTKVFAEGRKYVIGAVLTTQSPSQLAEEVQDISVLTQLLDNVWWAVSFNITTTHSTIRKLFGEWADELPALPAYRFMFVSPFFEGDQIVHVEPYTLETILLKDILSDDELEKLIRWSLNFWGVTAQEFQRDNVENVKSKFRKVLRELRALGRFSIREGIRKIMEVFKRPYGVAKRWFNLLRDDKLIVCEDTESCYVPQFVAVVIEEEGLRRGEEGEIRNVEEPSEVISLESLVKSVKSRGKERDVMKRLEDVGVNVSAEMNVVDVSELTIEELERVLRSLLFREGTLVVEGGRTYFVMRLKDLVRDDEVLKKVNPRLWEYAVSNVEDLKYQVLSREDVEEGRIDWDVDGWVLLGEDVAVPEEVITSGRCVFVLRVGKDGYELTEFRGAEGEEGLAWFVTGNE